MPGLLPEPAVPGTSGVGAIGPPVAVEGVGMGGSTFDGVNSGTGPPVELGIGGATVDSVSIGTGPPPSATLISGTGPPADGLAGLGCSAALTGAGGTAGLAAGADAALCATGAAAFGVAAAGACAVFAAPPAPNTITSTRPLLDLTMKL